jgi:acyl carrier protein
MPISGTLPNSRIYILDSYLNPLPIGAIGEVFIGGIGVGRGYLRKPDLTAEKFIANPFIKKVDLILNQNFKLYRTGDLARYLLNGNIQFLGRVDYQVKIRGRRIELGEIESVLSSYKEIKQSVVLQKEHLDVNSENTGNKYLIGYYVSNMRYDEDDIMSYMRYKLPEYMVPSNLVYLDQFPLTINGKLDRKSLPQVKFISRNNYVAPRNKLEDKICRVWSEVLCIPKDKISVYDDFFKLGGNSILVIKLANKLNKQLDSKISIFDIFNNNTVDKLVKYLGQNAQNLIVTYDKTWNF